MKAALYRTLGSPEVLEIVKDHAKPTRERGEVLVKVLCTSVNPIDWKIRSGVLPKHLVKLPKIPGGDVAGVVVEPAPGGKFKPGDKVFGMSNGFSFVTEWGAYAEYHAVPERYLVSVPSNLSMEEAGAVPLVSLTAWQALSHAFPLEGKRVLIHAGAGGVGSFAVQIAKALGAHVTTTCSERNAQFVTEELGADQVVDYNKAKFESAGRVYDCVVDLIGGDYEWRSLMVTKSSGVFVSVLNSGLTNKYGRMLGALVMMKNLLVSKLLHLVGLGPGYQLVMVQPGADQGMKQVADLISRGKVKVMIDRVLPLEEVVEAHKYMEQGHARGKVVLKVTDA